MSDEIVMPPHAEDCAWASSNDPCTCGLDDFIVALVAPRPMTCPTCGGAGIVDTSPPGVETAPWLATDTDCPACADNEPEETA